MKKKLFDFPTPLEEQKKIIRYLNDLDYPGNAGWECITKQSQWIRTMLVNCQVVYKSEESFEELHTFSKSPLGRKGSFLKNAMTPVPQGLLMVEDLCKIISEHLTELWNLGQTYLSNQLGDKRNPLEKSENATEKFLELVKEVITVFCEITDGVLHPPDKKQLGVDDDLKNDKMVQWLPEAVNAVRSTLDKMNNLITEQVIMPLQMLTSNSVADCVNKVLAASIREIQKLANEEKWDLNRSAKFYSTSELPYKFETIFLESLKFVRDFIRKHSKSDTKSESKYESCLSPKYIVPSLKKMLEEFLITLEVTVFGTAKDEKLASSSDSNDNAGVIQKDMQVLVLLSNCYHVKEVIVPRIMSQCVKYGYEEMNDFHEEIDALIEKLDNRVFMAYIEMKGEPIVGSIEVGINLGEYRWDGVQGDNNVRQYVQDILMKLVVIHDQVSSISNIFINRIFTLLVDLISDELLRIYECIDSFSQDGGLQASLELNVLISALGNYMSEKAKSNVTKSFDKIPSLLVADKQKMEEIMEKFKLSMCYQISAFSVGEDNILIAPDTL